MPQLDNSWPVMVLLLRIAAVGVLYLFLASAFGALRAELQARRPVVVPPSPRRAEPAMAPMPADAPTYREAAFRDPVFEGGVSEDAAFRDPAFGDPAFRDAGRPMAPPAPRGVPPRLAITLGGLALVVILGSAAALSLSGPETAAGPVSEPASANGPFGPPLSEPAPGRVTVGLAAVEDSQVRVTVDGVVQFDGTMRARERQAWEGSERIQVWTDSGQTLQLAVNGTDLGAYSPAMGHPDWNRIDFGFWPGWAQ